MARGRRFDSVVLMAWVSFSASCTPAEIGPLSPVLASKSVHLAMIARVTRESDCRQHLACYFRVALGRLEASEAESIFRVITDIEIQERLAGIQPEQRLRTRYCQSRVRSDGIVRGSREVLDRNLVRCGRGGHDVRTRTVARLDQGG